MLELRRVLGEQPLVEVAASLNDLLLDARLLAARLLVLVGECCMSLANQLVVVLIRHVFRSLHERARCVVAEHEADAVGVPPIEVRGHGEVGVAAQQDVSEAAATTDLDGLVEHGRSAFARGAVAGAIHDEERLARVGERDHQGVIAPVALVRHVHALLALAVGGDQRAVCVDPSGLRRKPRSALPDADANVVDDAHRSPHVVRFFEATTKVALGGRVRNRSRSDRIEKRAVVAAQLDVLEHLAAAQSIEGDVEDVVRVLVRTRRCRMPSCSSMACGSPTLLASASIAGTPPHEIARVRSAIS
jgi:hypothetical protein